MTDGHDRLQGLLDRGPISFAGLTDAQADQLADLVEAAKVRQREQLKAAVDGGLNNIPRLLRGPIKKLVF